MLSSPDRDERKAGAVFHTFCLQLCSLYHWRSSCLGCWVVEELGSCGNCYFADKKVAGVRPFVDIEENGAFGRESSVQFDFLSVQYGD